MKTKLIVVSATVLMVSFVLFSFRSVQPQKAKPWTTPEKYTKMKNTTKADDTNLASAKAMWNKYCKSCHGAKGLGDGTKAAGLKTHAGDFSSKEFQGLSDGVIYYRSFIGRDEMPNFEKQIPAENDRWFLVNYMRTMKK